MAKIVRGAYFIVGIGTSEKDGWIRKSHKEKIFYVYIKIRANGKAFWAGKGYGGRAFHHKKRNAYYSRIIEKQGSETIRTTIIPVASEAAAFLEEIRLIAYFKALGLELANLTTGGEGAAGRVVTPEERARISKALMGHAPANKGKPSPLRGVKHDKPSPLVGIKRPPFSQEHRDNLSKALRGKPLSPAHIEACTKVLISLEPWNKGKKTGPLSQEQKEKQSKALKGKKLSQEHCTKLSKAHETRVLPSRSAGGKFTAHP